MKQDTRLDMVRRLAAQFFRQDTQVFISGPKADYNSTGGVDYRITPPVAGRLSDAELRQLCDRARQIPGVVKVHVTEVRRDRWNSSAANSLSGGYLNIAFGSRSPRSPIRPNEKLTVR